MADNVLLNAGTGGDTVAADDIGPGVKYQRVKVTLGADGVNDGDVASGNPMPISGAVTNTVLSVVGNGAAATAQRVTIANDSTGTIIATQGTATSLKTQAEAYQGGSAVATGNALFVQPGTGASFTVAQGTATNLKAQAEVYQGGTAVGAAAPLQVTLANGSVPSHAVTNAGTFATQDSQALADNGGFTDGTSKVFPAGFIFDETAGTALTENDVGAARMDSKRATVGTIEDGTTRGQRASVSVDGRVGADLSYASDTFGMMRTTDTRIDVDVNFSRASYTSLVTSTPGGTGSNTQGSGYMTMATGATGGGTAKLVTLGTTLYNAGGEVAAYFTAAFPQAGAAGTAGSCYQRIGIYDTNNGFYIGYETTTFGISVRTGASDTQTAKASWNVDTLTGAAGSKFTRAGVVEAIDLTKFNIYRIRFGWLGSAPVRFEVLSPDGIWVLFHVIRQPNNAAVPSIQSPDLPITADVKNTGTSTNLQLLTNCWGIHSSLKQDMIPRPQRQVWKSYNDTSNRATAISILAPTSGRRLVITSVSLSVYGTTAGRIALYYGANGDTTYTPVTDQAVFVGSFAPSSTSKPIVVLTPAVPLVANTAGYELYYQNDAAMSVDIVVHGYEI